MTGISNGGMMAYAMAAEASGHVAAISSVSGQVEIPVIHPTRAVPTMEFHSVNDPIAKYDGTPSKNPLLRLSVMQGIDQWVKADGCNTKPQTGTVIVGAAGSISAGETATPITYTDCHAGAEVALWRFTGFGACVARQPAQHGPEEELDPGRRRARHHPRQRRRDDVAVLREVLAPLRSPLVAKLVHGLNATGTR